MKILVTHLTRMSVGHFCVAGVDAGTRGQIRPVLGGQLRNDLRQDCGGPYGIGNVVDLGSVTPTPNPPETEDHEFDPSALKLLGRVTPDRFLNVLAETANSSVLDAFGDEMVRSGNRAFFEYRTGTRSLAHLQPGMLERIYEAESGVRAVVKDERGTLDLSVTDARFYSLQNAIQADVFESLRSRLLDDCDAFLSVGVGRPFWKQNDRHYLQVNGIFPVNDPFLVGGVS